MVDEIFAVYKLNSPSVLAAMRLVPREEFVPHGLKHLAYEDRPVAIGFGQTISQPYTVAFMTDLVYRKKKKTAKTKILEIGTGSGYQAAVLSKLFDEVYTIERILPLARRAKKILKKLNYENIRVKIGSGEAGWKEKSPFDAVMVTANIINKVPIPLFSQLKVNGILVAPVKGIMMLYKKKKGNEYQLKKQGQFNFVPFVVLN